MIHYGLIILVVLVIIFFQLKAYLENRKKMKEFKTIFKDNNGKNIELTIQRYNGEITSIDTLINSSNRVWLNILRSINEYLGNNLTGTIRFDILKNTIDRNCDAVEEDINTLNPLPLYLGLVGTMCGIIIGIVYLIGSGSLGTLVGEVNFDTSSNITEGVQALLMGVAIAMFVSVIGIILTILNSWKFKGVKTEVEKDRNRVLVWLQANILPIVHAINEPTLIINNIAGQLEAFNTRFANNMGNLNTTLQNINQSYETIQKLNVVDIANVNLEVFKKLKDCTDNLDGFVSFFYTINTLHDKWEQELRDSESLEKIANFFDAEFKSIEQRKVEINKAVTKVDDALQGSFNQLNETYNKLISELNKRSFDTNIAFNTQLEDMTKAFNSQFDNVGNHFCSQLEDMTTTFNSQLENFPNLYAELEKISQIPQKLSQFEKEINKTNEKVITKFIEESKKSNSTLKEVIEKNTEVINAINLNQNKIVVKAGQKGSILHIVTIVCLIIVIVLLYLNLQK